MRAPLVSFLLMLLPVSLAAQKAQPIEPLPQPADLKLLLQTDDGRTEFHLGELIKLKIGYASPSAGRYLFESTVLSRSGMRSATIECTPKDKVIDRLEVTGVVSAWQMFYSGPGCGVGFGSGGGIGCADCDGETPITEKPEWWIHILLNQRKQFSQPGRYICRADSADVRLASTSRENPYIFELKSVPVELNIVKDFAWSKQTLDASVTDWQRRACYLGTENFVNCSEDAEVIRFLNTDDSLRAAASLYPGPEGWGAKDDFFKAFMENPNRKLALELLRNRSLDPDVIVNDQLAGIIVGMAIQVDSPSAFEPGSDPAVFHERSLSLLNTYLQDLGASLPKKTAKALIASRETYERMAGGMYCNAEPLVADSEVQAVLAAVPR